MPHKTAKGQIKFRNCHWGPFVLATLIVSIPRFFCQAETPKTPPGQATQLAIQKINVLILSENGQNIQRIKALDKQAEALRPQILKEKDAAIAPLAKALQDPALALKTRVFAANFLGLLSDPGAFTPLENVLLDSTAPDTLRSQAASILADVPVNAPARRRVFCQALAQENLPEFTLSQVLFEVSRLGCQDTALLKKRALAFGPHPQKKNKVLVLLAIQGLGESFSLDAADQLWDIFGFFHEGSSERNEILKALLAQSRREIPKPEDAGLHAEEALRSESRYPQNAILALKILVALEGKKAKPLLSRELKNPDPAVQAAAARALEKITASAGSER